MSEELQSLLERIEKDGVEKADAQATAIVKAAEAKAAELTGNAEAQAAALIAKAEEDSKAFEARSSKALDQAARDTILSVERGVAAIFARIAEKEVDAALDTETIRSIVGTLIETYAKADATGARMEIVLSEKQRADVVAHLSGRFQEQLAAGLTVEGTSAIASGFKVAVTDKEVEHDFTGEAVAEAMGKLLRSDLASIIKGSMAS
jgi:V/A-type H+-transporting ATPase subunit E